jgi:hypothetical protein
MARNTPRWWIGCGNVPETIACFENSTLLKRLNVAATPYGITNGMRPDGSTESSYHTIHPAMSTLMQAMTMIYTGDKEFQELGMDVVRRCWHNLVCRLGLVWSMPVQLDLDKDKVSGEDYYHNTSLWAFPAAILGQDLKTFCAPGSLVDRVIDAASKAGPCRPAVNRESEHKRGSDL